jgi:hypothetical protein
VDRVPVENLRATLFSETPFDPTKTNEPRTDKTRASYMY